MTHSIRSRRQAGFTLLELIVVITIIGLLSSVVVVATKNLPKRGRYTKAMQDMQKIHTVAEASYTDTGRYPESIEAMVSTGPDATTGRDPLITLETYPKDPWGNEYVYLVESGKVTVRCLGSDNAEGGDGEGVDLSYPPDAGNQ